MTKHIEILVNTNPVWAEYISDLLINDIGCSGVVTEEKEFKDEVTIKDDTETVKAYLAYSKDFSIKKLRDILNEEKNNLVESGINPENLGSWDVEIRELLEKEWAENWKKFWQPQKIGSNIVICPSWEDYEQQENDILINLDPGSAFGTGTHPTTKLCIQALEKAIPAHSKKPIMADIGTGSGILAITGVKLGISEVIGVDNDASVISVARENAEKNSVQHKCRFFTGSAADIDGKFDIVTANILTEVLIDIMPYLNNLIKPEGILILSGIIKRKLPLIEHSLPKYNLTVIQVNQEEEWVAPIIVRSGSQK